MTHERTPHLRNRQHVADNEYKRADEETTTLLNSETSSRTLRNGSSAGSRRDRGSGPDKGDSEDDDDDDDEGPKQSISATRAGVLMLSTWVLIFLQASNTSGMTMTQSVVAEDLEAYADAMWFTSSYLISMASLAPLFGRLATIFSPRGLVLPLGAFFAAGGVVTSQAPSFWVFIAGRILTGMGGAGIMTLSVILVLELVGKRRRGLFVGLVNAGFTIGLSFGAVVYGALLPVIGWVCLVPPFSAKKVLGGKKEVANKLTWSAEGSVCRPDAPRSACRPRRLLEHTQVVQLGPRDQRQVGPAEAGSHRLCGCCHAVTDHRPLPLRPLGRNPNPTPRPLGPLPPPLRAHRVQACRGPHHPPLRPLLPRRPPLVHGPAPLHVYPLDPALLRARFRPRRAGLRASRRGLDPDPDQRRLRLRRAHRRLAACPPQRRLLVALGRQPDVLRGHHVRPLVRRHRRLARVGFRPGRRAQRARDRRHVELHPRAPAAPQPPRRALRLDLAARHVPRVWRQLRHRHRRRRVLPHPALRSGRRIHGARRRETVRGAAGACHETHRQPRARVQRRAGPGRARHRGGEVRRRRQGHVAGGGGAGGRRDCDPGEHGVEGPYGREGGGRRDRGEGGVDGERRRRGSVIQCRRAGTGRMDSSIQIWACMIGTSHWV
ncbi:Vacuolar basic amino acid transporter 5 [Colletotrichum tanaceti]|nr:Vacuolar basic amino acid transporter 5 [Colletotrichum tanaceti]